MKCADNAKIKISELNSEIVTSLNLAVALRFRDLAPNLVQKRFTDLASNLTVTYLVKRTVHFRNILKLDFWQHFSIKLILHACCSIHLLSI